VFHAAEYDIICLKRDYGFGFANLFDTMIAARILGWSHYGLGPILRERFNVELDKRMQRFDWGTRPLPATAMDYARLDTHYLIPLKDLQLQELQTDGRLVEAHEAFRRRTQVEPSVRTFDPDGFWHIPGARQLDPAGQSVLHHLYIFRDDLARELDEPPFKVMSNATLLQLATDRPHGRRALAHVKGLSHRIGGRRADELLGVIARGLQAPPPPYPPSARTRLSDVTLSRYEALRMWRKHIAEVRQVEPDVILNNHALMELARRAPLTAEGLAQVKSMDDWQRQTYGEAVLEVLRRHTPRD
jgi:ribonuclease D